MITYIIHGFFAWFANIQVEFYLVAWLAFVWYLRSEQRLPENAPPFPVQPFPVVGHIPVLRHERLFKTFSEWKDKFGDAFSLKFGSNTVVVLNSYELIKEAFIKNGDHTTDKTFHSVLLQNQIETMGSPKGILFTNGSNWKEQRSVSMQILKEFGMGNNWLAEKITEELQIYLDTLSAFKGQRKELRMVTNAALSNVVCAILVGQRFELDDPYFVRLLRFYNNALTLMSNVGILRAFPSLRHLPGDLFKAKELIKYEQNFINMFSMAFILKAKKIKTNNFITSYLAEIDKKKEQGLPTSLDKSNLAHVINHLFGTGSETSSTAILWALLFAVHNPQAQERCYQEIMEVVGAKTLPSMEDKTNLNYVNAYIMETLRMGSVIPLGAARKCTQPIQLGGYTIPAGATILPNIHGVHHDIRTWGDPLVFRPERFLNADNKVFIPPQLIPFSIGRRNCLGEQMAKMELYLFIASIFQRFQVLPADTGNLPSLKSDIGLTNVPKPFSVRMMERGEYKSG